MVFPQKFTRPSRQALDLLLSMLKNYGELTFRVGSKCTLIGLAYLLDDRTFGQLSLFLVVEAIVNNISRFGVDRLILNSGTGVVSLPIRRHALLVGAVAAAGLGSILLAKLPCWLGLSVISGVGAGQFYILIVGKRLHNLISYNRLRVLEFVFRFSVLGICTNLGMTAFGCCIACGYAGLVLWQILRSDSWNNGGLQEYSRFSLFAIYSMIVFLLTGVDRLLISQELGLEIQGVYSKYLRVVGIMSFAYLFLGFVFEPKIYNENGSQSLKDYLVLSTLGNIVIFGGIFFFRDYFFPTPDSELLLAMGTMFVLYPFEFGLIYHLTKKKAISVVTIQQLIQLVIVVTLSVVLSFGSPLQLIFFILIAKAISLFAGTIYCHVASV